MVNLFQGKTVRSIKNNINVAAVSKIRSGIGKQVTEFYTAKDFPVYYSYTPIDQSSELRSHVPNIPAFIYNYAFDSRALSQGFIVAINDMHGKIKSQISYAENDESSPVNDTKYFYRNTGVNGLNEKFDFADASQGGIITQGNLGIDIELMNDLREFRVKTDSYELQGNLDLFPFIIPAWIPSFWPVIGNTENVYRAVTTTKVINYYSIVDSVVVIDKGSVVSTKNLVYDGETGNVIVTRTNNEFDQPIYNTTYPAWWAYSGMGPAYKNIGDTYTVNINNGKIASPFDQSIFESGDELYLINPGMTPVDACASQLGGDAVNLIWAYDKNKDQESLTTTPDFVFLDEKGDLYNRDNVQFRILRSGKRNLLEANLSNTTTMVTPINTVGNISRLSISSNSKVINASAVEYKEKWQTDDGVIKRIRTVYNSTLCSIDDVINCFGSLEKRINPYCKGLIGNFKQWKSKVFYNDRIEKDFSAPTKISQDGFLNAFTLYWDFTQNNKLLPNYSSKEWLFKDELMRKNSRGIELETKNALDIYSTAQYGYQGNLPLAITNNAQYSETGYEGFEDRLYNANLNAESNLACNIGHFDFVPYQGASIINSLNNGFTAHTGSYVLAVNKNTAFIQSFPVQKAQSVGFSLPFGTETPRVLRDVGGFISGSDQNPSHCNPDYDDLFHIDREDYSTGSQFQLNLNVRYGQRYCGNESTYSSYTYRTAQYIYAGGNIRFNISAKQTAYYKAQSPNMSILIYRVNSDGTEDFANPISCSSSDGGIHYNTYNSQGTMYEPTIAGFSDEIEACLPVEGIYRVQCSNSASYYPDGNNQTSLYTVTDEYSCNIQNFNGNSYKSPVSVPNCTYTTPIAGNDNMINSDFSVQANKKMLISAWVHEICGDAANGMPCKLTTFANNKIQLTDQNNLVFKELIPSGPIIDGWQRYEGDFTTPIGTQEVKLNFINTSSNPIYFDDIRIHPYNANMKSYVYDDINQRLVAELDENNYAKFYEYDEEGTLIRTKAETREGIKTLTENRSALANNLALKDYAAAKFRSTKDGNFSSPEIWELYAGNSWISATTEPSGNSDIEIRNNITLDQGLTIAENGNLVISSGQLSISAGVTLSIAGSADFNNLPVILHSDPSGTAAIGVITGTLANATNVTVEQYCIPKRSWHLITAPITGQTINAAWQEGSVWNGSGAPPASTGYGTLITYYKSVGAYEANQNGFDWINNGKDPSIEKYDYSVHNFVPITTTLTDIHTEQTYFLFVRGDRSVLGKPQFGSTILRSKGTLIQGDKTVSISNSLNDNNFIGNPYPSSIDFTKLYSYKNNSDNIQNKFVVWDPSLTGIYGDGAYITYTYNGNGYDITPATSNHEPKIESGSGFIIYPKTSNGMLEFGESVKSSPGNRQALRMLSLTSSSSQVKKLHVDLLIDMQDSTFVLDGVLAKFDTSVTTQIISDYSTGKLPNFGENLAILDNYKEYSLFAKHDLDSLSRDTTYLRLWNTETGHYQFLISAENFENSGLQAVLVDKYMHTENPISLTGEETIIRFSVSTDTAASVDTGRFYIVFKPVTSVSKVENKFGKTVAWHSSSDSKSLCYIDIQRKKFKL